jgi:dipeptidyl aminopeptidase/acylaminoacyl peptidase
MLRRGILYRAPRNKNVVEMKVYAIEHVQADDPPTILIHGDQDRAVPVGQSRSLIEHLSDAKVPARMVVREAVGHAYPGWEADTKLIADWFDEHLRRVR